MLVRCFNEARNIAIQYYLDTKKSFSKDMEQADDDDKNIDYDGIRILDMLEADEDLIESNRPDFIVKATQLVENWRKMQAGMLKNQLEANKAEEKEESPEEQERKKAEEEKKNQQKKGKMGDLRERLVTREGVGTTKVIEELIK